MKPAEVMQKVRLCDAKTPQPCWNGSPYQPIPITDEATAKQALQIRERAEDFPGITAEPEAVRRYGAPAKSNAAQVLGYLSPVTDEEITKAQDTDSPYLRSDQVGRSGLEREYDRELRGKAGVTRYEVDNLGRVIGQAEADEAQPGANLVTSIDARVQRVAEYELNDAMKVARTQWDRNTNEKYKADSGAVVVMEAKTGRIVAMASNPTYDPNAWVGGISAKDYAKLTGKSSNYPLLNRAIQGLSAPGSTFKVISTAAAVEWLRLRRPLPLHQLVLRRRPGLQELRVGELRPHLARPGPRGLLRHRLLRPRPPAVAEGRRHQPEEGPAQGLLLQGRPPVRPRQDHRHRPAQRGPGPHPRPPVEAGLLEGQQGRLVQDRQEGRRLRPEDRLRELPRRQQDARR